MSTKISKVLIKGFKSHLNTEFNYAPGLTVVTGPTDAGKSAGVMQPIKWVAFGEPSGEAFIFTIRNEKTKEIVKQAESAEVEIHTDDGMIILKTRRKGKTAYYINGKLISEKAEVPEEVKEALGLSKQAYGDFETSLNFAYQLEAPFILSETASVGAKVLGKLAGTEVVDKAIAVISKRTYKARDEKNTAQKIIDQVNVELIEYLQVDDLLTKVQACEGILEQLDRDIARKDSIDQTAARYGVISDKIGDCNKKLERLAVLKYLGDNLAAIDKGQDQYDVIDQLYSRLKYLGGVLGAIEARLVLVKDVGAAAVLLNQVETNYSRYIQLDCYCKDLACHEGQIQAVEIQLEGYKDILEVARLIQVADQEYDRLVSLEGLYGDWTSLTGRIIESEAVVGDCKHLGAISKILSDLELDEAKAQLLNREISYIVTIDTRKRQLEDHIKSFGVLSTCTVNLDAAIAHFDQLANLKQLIEDYNIKQLAVEAGKKKAAEATVALKAAEGELKAAWEEVGGVCPLCNQAVDSNLTH